MLILDIINFLVAAFLGYIIGRWGDNYLNFWINSWIKKENHLPHHWIYGLALTIIAAFYFKYNLGIWIFCFGIGLFISDLGDFLQFKILAPDGKTRDKKRFWPVSNSPLESLKTNTVRKCGSHL